LQQKFFFAACEGTCKATSCYFREMIFGDGKKIRDIFDEYFFYFFLFFIYIYFYDYLCGLYYVDFICARHLITFVPNSDL
jgi:hypothetical protein